MKVSVVVPCFNQAQYLPQCLENLLSQTYKNWECIVVDDGSTDGTSEVAQSYCKQENRIRYYYQTNLGLSGARNAGIAQATGELLYFLDSDDGLSPDAFNEFVNEFTSNPRLVLVYCGYGLTRETLTHVMKVVIPKIDLVKSDLYRLLCRGNIAPVHAAMVKREIVNKIGLFDETLKSAEDWDFWLRLARVSNNVTVIKKILVYYRLTLQSMTRNVKTFFEASLQVLERTSQSDSRVKDLQCLYGNGFSGNYEKARISLHLKCAGLYLSQHKLPEALDLIRKSGMNASIEASHIFEIWQHVLFGSLHISDRSGAWKKFAADMRQFISVVEDESQVTQLAVESLKKIKRYNSGGLMRVLYRFIN